MNSYLRILVVLILCLGVPVEGMKRNAPAGGALVPSGSNQSVIGQISWPVIGGIQVPFDIISRIIALLYAREKNRLARVNKIFLTLLRPKPSTYIAHNVSTFGIRDIIRFSMVDLYAGATYCAGLIKTDERQRRDKVINLIKKKKEYAISSDPLITLENQLVADILNRKIKQSSQINDWCVQFKAELERKQDKNWLLTLYITMLRSLQYAIVSNSVESTEIIIPILQGVQPGLQDHIALSMQYKNILLRLAIEHGHTQIASDLLNLGAKARGTFTPDIQADIIGIEKDLFLYTYADLLYVYDDATGKPLAKNHWMKSLFFDNSSASFAPQRSVISLVSLAALLGKGTLLELLVNKGGVVKWSAGSTDLLPLTAAALKGYSGSMKFLFEHDAFIYEYNGFIGLNYPLSAAVWSGDIDVVVELVKAAEKKYPVARKKKGDPIDKKSDEFLLWINTKNRNLATPLDIAVDCGYYHIAKYLIERGATVNNVAVDFSNLPASYKTECGFMYYNAFGLCSTLDRAIMTKNSAMVNLILSKDPKPVVMAGGKNARITADTYGDEEIKKAIKLYFDRYEKQYSFDKTSKERYIVIPYNSITVDKVKYLKKELEKYIQ